LCTWVQSSAPITLGNDKLNANTSASRLFYIIERNERKKLKYVELVACLSPNMPPLGEIAHKMDVSPPRWKEVEEVVRRAKASSAPGPNGVPYRVSKSAPDIL